MKVLVTGFGPFGRFESNPSESVARHLADVNEDVVAGVLPVVYGEGASEALALLERVDPDCVLSFGLNPTIGHFNLEEIAVNIRASELPDSDDNMMYGEPVEEGGPLALRSNLSLLSIRKRLREGGIPARLSYSAGVYLCNEVFYTVLRWCGHTGKRGGFIHIPIASRYIAGSPTDYGKPHMSLDMMKRGAEITLEEIEKETI